VLTFIRPPPNVRFVPRFTKIIYVSEMVNPAVRVSSLVTVGQSKSRLESYRINLGFSGFKDKSDKSMGTTKKYLDVNTNRDCRNVLYIKTMPARIQTVIKPKVCHTKYVWRTYICTPQFTCIHFI